jgi:hypothetical protein
MSNSFPQVKVGRCPLCSGGGAGPDTDAGSAFSSTQISSGEDVPLEYSPEYDQDVCILHRRKAYEENIGNERFTERDKLAEKQRQQMGFVKTYTPQS